MIIWWLGRILCQWLTFLLDLIVNIRKVSVPFTPISALKNFPVRTGLLLRAMSFLSCGILNILLPFLGEVTLGCFTVESGIQYDFRFLCIITVLYLLLDLALCFPFSFIFLNS
ncbi:hypothetical protein VNO78_01055 [Psophocarpus tetragonolobus]|uniref:Transmembrane protein n=1 Tax=Psophocarpus tetragonolobus TaxID=3891 RepID=A0AAN9XV02_PSOTE